LQYSARETFDACIIRARLDNSETFRASVREIGELANFGNNNRARRGLLILKQKGLLKYINSNEYGAYIYAFGDTVINDQGGGSSLNKGTIAVNSGVITVPLKDVEKDVFVHLGKVSQRVWRHLLVTSEPSIKAIARATQIPVTSVRYAMKNRLIPSGLVEKSFAEGLFIGITKTQIELEDLAEKSGTRGRNAKRKRANQVEREKLINRQMAITREAWANCYFRVQ
jgi:hypothetical protein